MHLLSYRVVNGASIVHPGYGSPEPWVYTLCIVTLNFALCFGIIATMMKIIWEEDKKELAKNNMKKIKLAEMVSDSLRKSVKTVRRFSVSRMSTCGGLKTNSFF